MGHARKPRPDGSRATRPASATVSISTLRMARINHLTWSFFAAPTDSNPCRHLERVPRFLQANRSNHVMPGPTPSESALPPHLGGAQLTAQSHQLGPLVGVEPGPAAAVDVVLFHPPTQARGGDAEIGGHLGHR